MYTCTGLGSWGFSLAILVFPHRMETLQPSRVRLIWELMLKWTPSQAPTHSSQSFSLFSTITIKYWIIFYLYLRGFASTWFSVYRELCIVQALEYLLVNCGANPSSTDTNTGATLLHWASQRGNAAIVQLLIQNEAEVDKTVRKCYYHISISYYENTRTGKGILHYLKQPRMVILIFWISWLSGMCVCVSTLPNLIKMLSPYLCVVVLMLILRMSINALCCTRQHSLDSTMWQSYCWITRLIQMSGRPLLTTPPQSWPLSTSTKK